VPEAFAVCGKSFIFSKIWVSSSVGRKKAGVAHCLILSMAFNAT
jgi:hypothetical protein